METKDVTLLCNPILCNLKIRFSLQMNFWLFPSSNALVNTFIRGCLVLLATVYGFKMSWYNGYWLAIVHDSISLFLIKDLV